MNHDNFALYTLVNTHDPRPTHDIITRSMYPSNFNQEGAFTIRPPDEYSRDHRSQLLYIRGSHRFRRSYHMALSLRPREQVLPRHFHHSQTPRNPFRYQRHPKSHPTLLLRCQRRTRFIDPENVIVCDNRARVPT